MTIRDVFRPIGGSSIIWADDWRCLYQGGPGGGATIPPKNPSSFLLYQNKYDSLTWHFDDGNIIAIPPYGATKLIMHYEKPIEYGSVYPTFILGMVVSSVFRMTPTADYIATGELAMRVRYRPILSDWDPETISWNNHASELNIGGILTPNLPVIWAWAVAAWPEPGYSKTQGALQNGSGTHPMSPNYASPGKIYGIIVDAALSYTSWTYTFSETIGAIEHGLDGARCPKPYLFIPE